jgi:hypothetical protein
MRKLSPLVIAVAGSVALPALAQTPPATTPFAQERSRHPERQMLLPVANLPILEAALVAARVHRCAGRLAYPGSLAPDRWQIKILTPSP